MKMLNGITKETFEEFAKRVNRPDILSFVRKNKQTDKGGIWFGNRQYAVADFESSDDNILVNYNETGGLNLNYNLKYDYEFETEYADGMDYQLLLYLPRSGTYTFLVERKCNGSITTGYLSIGLADLTHEHFSVGIEGLYMSKGGYQTYRLCVPSKTDSRAPSVYYKFKLIGSSNYLKKNITVYEHQFVSGTGNQNIEEIPCICKNFINVIINTGDTSTTYSSTAVVQSNSGVCDIVSSGNIENYVINTDTVDDEFPVVLSVKDENNSSIDFSAGIYRFKLSDSVYGGVNVVGSTTNYEYDGDVVKNSILSLSVVDGFYEWSINRPNVYSSDDSIDVDIDVDGNFDITSNEGQIIPDFTLYEYEMDATNEFKMFCYTELSDGDPVVMEMVSVTDNCPNHDNVITLKFASGSLTVYGGSAYNGRYSFGTYGVGVDGEGKQGYFVKANENVKLLFKLVSKSSSTNLVYGDERVVSNPTNNIYYSVASSFTESVTINAEHVQVPNVNSVIDYTNKFISGVTLNGETDGVTLLNNVVDLDINKSLITYAGDSLTNGLVGAFYDLSGNQCNTSSTENTDNEKYVKLFSLTTSNGNSVVNFKVESEDYQSLRVYDMEYEFQSSNLSNANGHSLICKDAMVINNGATNVSVKDVVYAINDNTVTFYKKTQNTNDSFTVVWNYIDESANVTMNFNSIDGLGAESIDGKVWNINIPGTEDKQYTHSVSSVVAKSAIGTLYNPKDLRDTGDDTYYNGLETNNKTIIGAINEIRSTTPSNYISGITINNSTESVSVEDKVANLTIQDWSEQIASLQSDMATVLSALNTNGNSNNNTNDTTELWTAINSLSAQMQTLINFHQS